MTQNNYCDIVDNCKIVKAGNDMLKRANNQYNKVVKQNKNLQGQLRELQEKFDERERDLLVVEELNTTLQLKIRELETDGLTLVKQIDNLEADLRAKSRLLMQNNDHYHNVDVKNKKLEQFLKEIKELAKDYCDCENCSDEDIECKDCEFFACFEIIQKVNEVQNG